MRDFKSDKRSRGRRDFSRKPSLHEAVCDKCGEKCQVPFKPSGDKPIYCSDCFEKKGGGRNQRFSRDRGSRSGGDSSGLMEKIEVLDGKLDKILSLLVPVEEEKADKKEAEEE